MRFETDRGSPVAKDITVNIADLTERYIRLQGFHHGRHDIVVATANAFKFLDRCAGSGFVSRPLDLLEATESDVEGVIDTHETVDFER